MKLPVFVYMSKKYISIVSFRIFKIAFLSLKNIQYKVKQFVNYWMKKTKQQENYNNTRKITLYSIYNTDYK